VLAWSGGVVAGSVPLGPASLDPSHVDYLRVWRRLTVLMVWWQGRCPRCMGSGSLKCINCKGDGLALPVMLNKKVSRDPETRLEEYGMG
jgi:hypothetical protein